MHLNCELVGFCDGSSEAYGCVLYLKWINEDESFIGAKFVGAKSKVAPIKGNTVPRKELNAALILARLTWATLESVRRTEISRYNLEEHTKLNSDSTCVLSWIRSSTSFKPFVKNKVVEIQNLTPSVNWRYVPSRKNKTADLLSKGCNRDDIQSIINGPDILKTPNNDWPPEPKGNKVEIDSEKLVKFNIVSVTVKDTQALFDISKYNSWKKLIRVTAYALKFISKSKDSKDRKGNKKRMFDEADIFCNPRREDLRIAEILG